MCRYLGLLLLFWAACKPPYSDPSVLQKIKFDIKKLDENGLAGPPDGKRALDYEFCIPRKPAYWEEVKRLDPSAKQQEAKGRIGCTAAQWLIIGNTSQPEFKKILYNLAQLSYIERIEETVWE